MYEMYLDLRFHCVHSVLQGGRFLLGSILHTGDLQETLFMKLLDSNCIRCTYSIAVIKRTSEAERSGLCRRYIRSETSSVLDHATRSHHTCVYSAWPGIRLRASLATGRPLHVRCSELCHANHSHRSKLILLCSMLYCHCHSSTFSHCLALTCSLPFWLANARPVTSTF